MPDFRYTFEHSTASGSGSIRADDEKAAAKEIERSLIDATVVLGDAKKEGDDRPVDKSATKEAKAKLKETLKVELEQITE